MFFKKLLIKKRIKEGKEDPKLLQSLNFPPPKFTSFSVFSGKAIDTDTLRTVFKVEGVQTDIQKKKIMLTDEELSASLEYIFKKCTEEIVKFNEKKVVDKIGVM